MAWYTTKKKKNRRGKSRAAAAICFATRERNNIHARASAKENACNYNADKKKIIQHDSERNTALAIFSSTARSISGKFAVRPLTEKNAAGNIKMKGARARKTLIYKRLAKKRSRRRIRTKCVVV